MVKRFERSNGLDTALYKNYLYLFFYMRLLGVDPKDAQDIVKRRIVYMMA